MHRNPVLLGRGLFTVLVYSCAPSLFLFNRLIEFLSTGYVLGGSFNPIIVFNSLRSAFNDPFYT